MLKYFKFTWIGTASICIALLIGGNIFKLYTELLLLPEEIMELKLTNASAFFLLCICLAGHIDHCKREYKQKIFERESEKKRYDRMVKARNRIKSREK